MMILRWLWFAMGICGWVIIVCMVWQKMGWTFGGFTSLIAAVSILDWFERTMLKQYKMKKVTTYEEEA